MTTKKSTKAEPAKTTKPSSDPSHGADNPEQWQALRDACSVEVVDDEGEGE